ncbi:hypothetical protein ACT3CE_11520 [Marinifilum sp. RC60d5]|uniref:hypothetical protein n=1 Tax=Marinifilum sp. RC60d5 TaxID=3458414 RepID=UPI0040373833
MNNYAIIGGSTGIGKELVHLLVKSGHRVFATSKGTIEDLSRTLATGLLNSNNKKETKANCHPLKKK